MLFLSSAGLNIRHLCGGWLCALFITLTVVPFSAAATPFFPRLAGPTVHEVPLGPPVQKPVVLLVVLDTIRPDHMSLYGYPRPTTPFIASLASGGITFANHFSNSTWTKPSMASLFTGLFPRRHNVVSIPSKLSPGITTLAQAFKNAGFKTGAVLANNFGGRNYGMDRGFDRFADPSTHFEGKHPTAVQVLELAKTWMAQDRDQPMFYTVFLFDPHDPYAPPPEYKATFCPDCRSPEIVTPWREYRGHGPTAKQIEDMKHLYDGELRYTDDQLKAFFGDLRELGLGDRLTTLIVGDHGEAFGEHGVFEHAFHTWDEVLRTPFILNSPRVATRGVFTGLTQHSDVMPTLLKLADVPLPAGIQGLSMVQEEGDDPPPASRLAVSEVEMYGIYRVALRNQQHKLIHHNPLDEAAFHHFYTDARIYPSVVRGTTRRELYNVIADPREHKDLYLSERTSALPLEEALEHYLRTGELMESTPTQAPSEEVLRDLKSLGYIQ